MKRRRATSHISASIIVALDYSLGDPFGPFMLAKHLSSYFATLRMDNSLKYNP